MPDDMQPVITTNEIKNGSIVTLVFETGSNSQIRHPDVNQHEASGDMNARITGRFDDPRYYTGDSAS
jgi:hypothetical protein|tara:strand:- start:256 stop:456 length:201 start_codon:yes stop_codon:yes gene_type:complete